MVGQPKGMQSRKTSTRVQLVLATGEPTFNSSNTRLTPTALDFFIVNGVPINKLSIETEYDISYDHLPIVATLSHTPQHKSRKKSLLAPGSSVETFRNVLDRSINLNMDINYPEDIEDAIVMFMDKIHVAATLDTPGSRISPTQS